MAKKKSVLPPYLISSVRSIQVDYRTLARHDELPELSFLSNHLLPKFVIDSELDTEWGYCVPQLEGLKKLPIAPYRYEIGLVDTFPTRGDYLETLGHEMMHLVQMAINQEKSDHGPKFLALEKKLKNGIKKGTIK